MVLAGAMFIGACNNGNRDYNMPTNVNPPAGSNDTNNPSTFDTSASGTGDSTTVIGYDTAVRKQ